MKKLIATIVLVLKTTNRPLYRTELVKFIYLIDEMYYKHFGRTVTGLNYKWDNFGPNSEDDAIVNQADHLVSKGFVHMTQEPNQYGGTSYRYSLEESTKNSTDLTGVLSSDEQYLIKNITCRFKGYSLDDLIAASKAADSFRGVKQYEPITLRQSKRYSKLVKSLETDKEFAAAVKAMREEPAA